MKIADILDTKGRTVHSVLPWLTVAEVVERLGRLSIGAVLVCDENGAMQGIVSERDIVRRLAESGGAAVRVSVAEVMTTDVVTCGPDATVDELMATMTNRRIRHIPVLENGRLAGIVSIGDVVKSRIDDLETTTATLSEYVTGSSY
jgi:CBS domain-containing protein